MNFNETALQNGLHLHAQINQLKKYENNFCPHHINSRRAHECKECQSEMADEVAEHKIMLARMHYLALEHGKDLDYHVTEGCNIDNMTEGTEWESSVAFHLKAYPTTATNYLVMGLYANKEMELVPFLSVTNECVGLNRYRSYLKDVAAFYASAKLEFTDLEIYLNGDFLEQVEFALRFHANIPHEVNKEKV